MRTSARSILFCLSVSLFFSALMPLQARSNAGLISGVVTDPSGAVVPGAAVSIENSVSGYTRTALSDSTGHFQFPNLPFNPYRLTVSMTGFATQAQDVDVLSTVPV